MNKFSRIFAAALLSPLLFVVAQEADTKVRVEFPTGDASWSVRFGKDVDQKADASKKSDDGPSPKQMDVVRQGVLRRDTIVWTDEGKSEIWWSGSRNYVFFQNRGDTSIRGIRATQRGASRYDESFFSWVGPKSYVDNRKLDGKELWYFEKTYEVKLPDGTPEKEFQRAWVDPETALPYAWSDGQRVAFFEFNPLDPEFRLVMPPNFKEKFESYDAYTSPPVRVKRR